MKTITISAGSRGYFLDLRKDSTDQSYVTVAEVARNRTKRSCIYIFPEHLDAFIKALVDIRAQVSQTNEK